MIDPLSDKLGTVFHKIMQKHSAPSFITKSAFANLDPETNTEMFNTWTCYADPVHKTFPCHTKEATWVSYAYFNENKDAIQEPHRSLIKANLEKQSQFFGIEEEFAQLHAEDNQMQKAAAAEDYPEDYYAINMVVNNQAYKQGLMRDPGEVKAASAWLVKNRDQLPFDTCHVIADRIMKRAGALNVELQENDSLERMLGLGADTTKNIVDAIKHRAKLAAARQPELGEELTQLADRFASNPPPSGSDELLKLASCIDQFDSASGLLSQRKSGNLVRPEDVLFSHTVSELTKYASQHVHLQNGNVYALDDLSKIDKQDFEDTFGSSLTDECFDGRHLNKEAAADIWPTLPRPDANRLAEVLGQSSISPVSVTKASSAVTIPEEFYHLTSSSNR